MAKNCIYCKTTIPADTVLDVCENCGNGVWGQKMYNAIKKSMEDAREKGDLLNA
ncbi:MAG: hypothetical protein AABX48_04450 [Nanoarchaeota archaeon]